MTAPTTDWESACNDCGSALVWRHALPLRYCKRCYVKGGHLDYVRLDLDKLDAKLGPEVADAVVRECESD